MSTLLEERNVENAILKIYKKWEKLKKKKKKNKKKEKKKKKLKKKKKGGKKKKKKKKSSGGWYITSKITFSIYKKNQIKDKNNRL